jgi:hypothetical protein
VRRESMEEKHGGAWVARPVVASCSLYPCIGLLGSGVPSYDFSELRSACWGGTSKASNDDFCFVESHKASKVCSGLPSLAFRPRAPFQG